MPARSAASCPGLSPTRSGRYAGKRRVNSRRPRSSLGPTGPVLISTTQRPPRPLQDAVDLEGFLAPVAHALTGIPGVGQACVLVGAAVVGTIPGTVRPRGGGRRCRPPGANSRQDRSEGGGTPGRDRTCDLRIRSPSLCPTELRAPRSIPARHVPRGSRLRGGAWGERRDLNPQPLEPQSSALTIELRSPSWLRPTMVRTVPGPVNRRSGIGSGRAGHQGVHGSYRGLTPCAAACSPAATPAMAVRVVHVITRMIVGGPRQASLLTARYYRCGPRRVPPRLRPGDGPGGDHHAEIAASGVPTIAWPARGARSGPRWDVRALVALVTLFRRLRPHLVHARSAKGHGMGSFGFRGAEHALAQGFLPDTISTDRYRRHLGVSPRHDLPRTLSKLLAAGMPEPVAFLRVTARPAAILGLAGRGRGPRARGVGGPRRARVESSRGAAPRHERGGARGRRLGADPDRPRGRRDPARRVIGRPRERPPHARPSRAASTRNGTSHAMYWR